MFTLSKLLFGTGIAAVSGVLLFMADPVAVAGNPAFRCKLGLMAIAGLNALRFHLGPFRTAGAWEHGRKAPLAARIAAGVSLVVWVGVVTAGRLIAYV